jgi:MFS family permease
VIAEDLAPRSSFRLVVDPVFGTFFWGKVLSAAGIWIFNIVAVIVAYEVSRSALIVGLVSAAQFAPQLVLGPLSGAMADRGNARAQIVIGRVVSGLGAAGLAIVIAAVGGVDGLPNAWPVLAASLMVGLGFVIGGPAMQSMIPDMVRPGELPAAMALNSAPMTFARAGGPALGALVATQLGPEVAFAIAAATNIIFGVAMFAIRLPQRPAPDPNGDFTMRAVLDHLRLDPALGALLIGVAVIGFAAEPAMTLAPALAAELDGGTHLVGWLTSAFGVGAALGFALFTSTTRLFGLARLASGGLLLMCLGLTVTAFTEVHAVVLSALGVAGLGMMLSFTSISTLIQQHSPAHLRGRIMALWMVGFLGARPFAAAIDGWLADAVSVQAALLLTADVVVVAGYLCRPSRLGGPSIGPSTAPSTDPAAEAMRT